jgi:hypothetical protein
VDDVVDELGLVVVVVVVVVVVGGGPVDTTMLTALPGGTCVPAGGSEEMINPEAYEFDGAEVSVPKVRLTLPSAIPAFV